MGGLAAAGSVINPWSESRRTQTELKLRPMKDATQDAALHKTRDFLHSYLLSPYYSIHRPSPVPCRCDFWFGTSKVHAFDSSARMEAHAWRGLGDVGVSVPAFPHPYQTSGSTSSASTFITWNDCKVAESRPRLEAPKLHLNFPRGRQ